jgi:hypothetical protein
MATIGNKSTPGSSSNNNRIPLSSIRDHDRLSMMSCWSPFLPSAVQDLGIYHSHQEGHRRAKLSNADRKAVLLASLDGALHIVKHN